MMRDVAGAGALIALPGKELYCRFNDPNFSDSLASLLFHRLAPHAHGCLLGYQDYVRQGSISSAPTSTATLWRIRSTESTTRSPHLVRISMPLTPVSGPDTTRTLLPTTRNGWGSYRRSGSSVRSHSISLSEIDEGTLCDPANDRTPGMPSTLADMHRSMRTNT